jgi:hypothetical protein
VVSFTPRPLYPQGKNPWYPLNRRLSGPQSPSGRGEEKNCHTLPGLETTIIRYVSLRYTTELRKKRTNPKKFIYLIETTSKIKSLE